LCHSELLRQEEVEMNPSLSPLCSLPPSPRLPLQTTPPRQSSTLPPPTSDYMATMTKTPSLPWPTSPPLSPPAINLSRQLWRLQHLPLWYYLQQYLKTEKRRHTTHSTVVVKGSAFGSGSRHMQNVVKITIIIAGMPIAVCPIWLKPDNQFFLYFYLVQMLVKVYVTYMNTV
jgi:type IV secretory pathway VirB10-like protein